MEEIEDNNLEKDLNEKSKLNIDVDTVGENNNNNKSEFDLDKIDYNQKVNKEKRWTHDILQKGTFDDKISALLLYIRENPKMTLKYLEILIKLSENKNRRKNDAVIIGLKDLFLESILQGKKYISFNNKYKNIIKMLNVNQAVNFLIIFLDQILLIVLVI